MGIIAIVGYRPKEGQSEALKELMKTHVPILRREGLATERESIVMAAKDGTIVEVFEWKSRDAIESAHTNPEVMKMWGEYEQACEYIPVAQIPETSQLFSEFEAVSS